MTSYFTRISKAENYELVMWRRGWHNPTRASWDPAPNLHLVMLDLGHDSIGIPVSLGISCSWVHHPCAPCCSAAGRKGTAGSVGEASWLDFPVDSLLGVYFSLKQWFSTGGAFSSPTHPGHVAMSGTFLVVAAEEGGTIGI